ncbi:hypothetical protein SeMB42_g07074 [Synchytrium endobioticum]|uniref:Uncharacterized protein n=1 Tax=Synchytrium endobioticum TaxID=286115 RepID=A0A507CEJ7_9FUNG|nr:hypothetical protein SeMB42_g07074 [Synchytrium endobioticum]
MWDVGDKKRAARGWVDANQLSRASESARFERRSSATSSILETFKPYRSESCLLAAAQLHLEPDHFLLATSQGQLTLIH